MPIFITASFIVVKGDNNPYVHQLDDQINKCGISMDPHKQKLKLVFKNKLRN